MILFLGLFRLVYESLQRRSSGHLQSFQSSIKTHMSHVNQRQARVMKYGQAQTINVNGPIQMPEQAYSGTMNGIPITSGNTSGKYGSSSSSGYAMFGMPRPSSSNSSHGAVGVSQAETTGTTNSSSQLRRRNQQPSSASSTNNSFGGAVQQVQTQMGSRNDSMYRQSQKVEKSIAQMGMCISL